MNKAILLSVIFIILSSVCYAQDNPFFSGNDTEESTEITAQKYPGFIHTILDCLNNIQRELNSLLSELSRKINEENDYGVLILLIGIAFIYGCIHAIGPGHGKVIMFSYALSNPLKAKQGIFLGIFIAVVHTLSAVILVSLLYFILNSTYAAYSREPKTIISLVSYGLIACMGLFLLIKTIITDIIKPGRNHEKPEMEITEKNSKLKNLIIPAFIIGLVPCEGAILILIFSISINAHLLGIVLSAVMSLGIAVTVSLIGIIAIYSKKSVLKFAKTEVITKITTIIQIAGAALVLFFGLLMFLSRLI